MIFIIKICLPGCLGTEVCVIVVDANEILGEGEYFTEDIFETGISTISGDGDLSNLRIAGVMVTSDSLGNENFSLVGWTVLLCGKIISESETAPPFGSAVETR